MTAHLNHNTLTKTSVAMLLLCGAASSHAQEAFNPESPWMLGDWGGLRSELLEKGYTFNVLYTGDAATNLAGGYDSHTTARYTDQLALMSNLDLEKIFGWQGADFQFTISDRNGRNLTNDVIVDPRVGGISQVQEVYGRGQTWRLTQLWYRQKFFDGGLDIKLGRMNFGEDFGSFPCKFQNLAFCGAQPGNWAGDIIYNWPITQWAGRVKVALSDNTYAQIGAYEQNPSYLEIGNGFKLSGSGNEGTLVPIELVHTTSLGAGRLPGEYRVGAYYSSRNANDVNTEENGVAKSRDSKHGAWIAAQQQVWKDPDFAARGLSVFAYATVHDKATNMIDRSVQAGVYYTAPFKSRPNDEIGVAISNIHVNERFKDHQQQLNNVAGVSDYDDPRFTPTQGSETNMEIYYGFGVTKWLTVRPNLQFVGNPGGVSEVKDAWVAGLKFETSL
ncbi:carbohydrate porin [Pseudomonas sp. GL-R-19]|uniref:carbohydrate porin n=1 Tax=Pseudomonas sp. GL-R-19 TaxID=2832391 RepID=UPI0029588A87|nr:carbohydrate porin [Pseudomonas sp. GL-R-19]